MSSHEEHHSESPKKVYFGIPIGFALAFWFIVFLSLKACDGGSRHQQHCDGKEECSKECMEKCKAEGKDCAKSCEENEKETKEGEKVGAGMENNKTEDSNNDQKSSTQEGKPDSPAAVKGEKSPTEKSDSAKGH